MRWLPRSLHARMLALSLAATLVALAIAGSAITGVLEHFVMQGLDQRLDAEVALLAASVDQDGRVDRQALRERLGAFDGRPGWRWRIVTPDGAIGSADFPPLDAGPPGSPAPPPPDADRLRPRDGGLEDGARVHARELVIDSRRGLVTLTAAAPHAIVERPIRAALVPLLAALAALAALLTVATLVQLRIGLRPLRRLRDQVAAIRGGTRSRVDEDQPLELRGLAVELNALSEANATALATARATAANLAHALKTPVAALALDLRDDPPRAVQVARIDATIRHHLARARTTAIDRRASTPLAPAIDGLLAVVSRAAAERDVAIDVVATPGLAVAAGATDLDELVGNLLDNAVRHAARRVCVIAALAREEARRVVIEVIDDGPGIAAADRARATAPGVRLDECGNGHGFGLSIVTDLAALYGGSLELMDAPGGGLHARLALPAAG